MDELPADCPEAWREEIESLESILEPGELVLEGAGWGLRRQLLADARPAFSRLTLRLSCPAGYPAQPLQLQLADLRGLTAQQEHELQGMLVARAQQLAEDAMPACFELFQEAQDYLTAHNSPLAEDCVICYERLQSMDLVLRTPCFHYFHKKCFARFLVHRYNNPDIDASAELYQELRRVHHTEEAVEAAMLERARQAPTPCPTCREVVPRTAETLSAALALCSSSSGDDELESRAARAELSAFLSAEQRKLQEQRRTLFERQLSRGGIIDAFCKPADHNVIRIRQDEENEPPADVLPASPISVQPVSASGSVAAANAGVGTAAVAAAPPASKGRPANRGERLTTKNTTAPQPASAATAVVAASASSEPDSDAGAGRRRSRRDDHRHPQRRRGSKSQSGSSTASTAEIKA